MAEVVAGHGCIIKDLGLIDYQDAYRIQKQTICKVIEENQNVLLICEHFPVFTLGRLATETNFLLPKEKIQARGIEIVRIDRGGEVTFHGPGQLVAYPIFQLDHFGKDLKIYMSQLEQVAVDLLQSFGIVANRINDQRGVWVNRRKIASIGIGVRKWVSFHGMAINVNTDLNYFGMIKPCGLDVRMTSIRSIKGKEIDMNKAKEGLICSFRHNFKLDIPEKQR